MKKLKIALSALAALVYSGQALSQEYPSKPIHFVSQFAAGGGQYKIYQIVSDQIRAKFGAATVIENRPGGTGGVAKQYIANAPADGYAVMIGSAGPMIITPLLKAGSEGVMGFKDFAPVTLLAITPYVVTVHPSLPVNSIAELNAYAKANPGVLNYCSTGAGSGQQIVTELYKSMAGVDFVHVPFAGGGASVAGVLSNVVQVCISDIGNVSGHLASGLLKGLATTGATRSEVLPNLPTVAEAGVPGYEASSWHGLYAPANTPSDVVEKLSEMVRQGLADPEAKKQIAALGLEVRDYSPEQFAEFMRLDSEKWAKVIKDTNIKAE